MSESGPAGDGRGQGSRQDGWLLAPDAAKGPCTVRRKVLRPSVWCWSQERGHVPRTSGLQGVLHSRTRRPWVHLVGVVLEHLSDASRQREPKL